LAYLSREADDQNGFGIWLQQSSDASDQQAQYDGGDGQDQQQIAEYPWTLLLFGCWIVVVV